MKNENAMKIYEEIKKDNFLIDMYMHYQEDDLKSVKKFRSKIWNVCKKCECSDKIKVSTKPTFNIEFKINDNNYRMGLNIIKENKNNVEYTEQLFKI